jgi:hypothetical protein
LLYAIVAIAHADAQWLDYPTPDIPRLPNGKADLSAPVRRMADGKPDLSGLWVAECNFSCPPSRRPSFDLAQGLAPAEVEMTPWASAVQRQRVSRELVDDPLSLCLPPGVPRIMFSASGFKLVQTPFLTVLLNETQVMLTFRQVFTDGRPLPVDPQPTWLGYSVGRWEEDTFVIETSGFRDGGWLDLTQARPHSEALRVVERMRRTDFGHMEYTVTIDDPEAYLRPWTVKQRLVLRPDTDLIEAFCEGQQDFLEHRRVDPAPPEPPSPPRAPSQSGTAGR